MKKYFVVSDIHSFYDELIKNLNKKGFDVNNQNHVLIVCGDIFDRGTQPLEVYHFLRNLPKERRILIRGNHELLLKELVEKEYAESYDESNGTYGTLFYLLGLSLSELKETYYRTLWSVHIDNSKINLQHFENIKKDYKEKLQSVFHSDIVKEILNWIASDEWVNYWETNKYIFCHAWIPTYQDIDWDTSRWMGQIVVRAEYFREDWRNATQTEWEDAMWGCPWKKAQQGLNKTNKIIVCGHWHTSDFFNNLTKQRKGKYECPIFKSTRYKLIGLDACTVISRKINVLVLNEDEL